jgi:uncharacterized repeat protein (TIGR01451 family)
MKKIVKILKEKLTSRLVAFLTLFIAAIISLGILAKAQANPLYATLGGSKTQVTPGETLEYVVTVRNDSVGDLTNVTIAQSFPSQITYVAGTAKAEKNGQTLKVDDDWVIKKAGIGRLAPNQTAYFKFQGKIADNVSVGSKVENVVQVQAEEIKPEWLARAFTVEIVSPEQRAALRGGNFLKVTNNTLQNGWNDSVTVSDFHVVEFLVKISNDGDFDARNVNLRAFFAATDEQTQYPRVTLTADNADAVTDEVTVQGQNPFHLSYKVGHATLFGNTELYNCPNGCPIPESFYHTPLNLGTVHKGESATIQVTFKADVIPGATSTPTPTPTPTPGPDKTRLKICKYEDDNGNGERNDGEDVLSWTFRYIFDNQTHTVSSNWWYLLTQGCTVVDVPVNKEIRVEEEGKSGWHLTGLWADGVKQSGSTYTYTSKVDEVKVIWFLNSFGAEERPTPTPTPQVLGAEAPKKLPETGSEVLLTVPTLFGIGAYLYKRFKLI